MQEFGPRIGTAIFIVRDDGRFLFLKRKGSHGAGSWSTPGGHVDFGEDPVETCKREAQEETGVGVDGLAFVTLTNDYFEKDGKHYVTLWYVGKWNGLEPENLEPDKCDEIRWVDFDEMPTPRLLTYSNLTQEQNEMLRQKIHEIGEK